MAKKMRVAELCIWHQAKGSDLLEVYKRLDMLVACLRPRCEPCKKAVIRAKEIEVAGWISKHLPIQG